MNKKKKNIVIIDYGFGNLFSLKKALEHIGEDPLILNNSKNLKDADAIILPGVGAFGDGIEELRRRGFEDPLKDFIKSGKPILGICLGMQFLFEKSEEFGTHKGLGYIQGTVTKMKLQKDVKVPHVGWNKLFLPDSEKNWDNTLLHGIKEESQVYFVHSFVALPENSLDILSFTSYGGAHLTAVVCRDNIYGTQFHPEKSGDIGLKILKNFVKMA